PHIEEREIKGILSLQNHNMVNINLYPSDSTNTPFTSVMGSNMTAPNLNLTPLYEVTEVDTPIDPKEKPTVLDIIKIDNLISAYVNGHRVYCMHCWEDNEPAFVLGKVVGCRVLYRNFECHSLTPKK
ncbi:MAG: hypothetical protein AAF226_04130, partial [Verrucomicrobiota bacterium]